MKLKLILIKRCTKEEDLRIIKEEKKRKKKRGEEKEKEEERERGKIENNRK